MVGRVWLTRSDRPSAIRTDENIERVAVLLKEDLPKYSPDLSYPDYFAFLKLKLELKGDKFKRVEDIQKVVTDKLFQLKRFKRPQKI